jgi:hypothetical protein
MGTEWGGNGTARQKDVCRATCPTCLRRCAKNAKHLFKHRCLRHGSF